MTDVQALLGIPYARPPLGELRWQAPEPLGPWDGSSAGVLPPAPPQPTDGTPGGAELPGLQAARTDEDCLFLNVWAPAGVRDAPVLVWLPGGAFVTGGASLPLYDGASLAARGVVVVSVTYRVGAIGFAALPGCPPNRGLLDQVAALRWIRDHIGSLGGDPANVTLFGESAGGGSILHLLAVPAAAGLLRRAIVQSGATDLTLGPDAAARVAAAFTGALAGDPRTAPVDDLLVAQQAALLAGFGEVGAMPFHPFVDGEVLTGRPVDLAVQAPVDLLVGTTRDEMRLFLDPRSAGLDRDRLVRRSGRYLASLGGPEDRAADLVDRYDGDPHLPTPGDVWSAVQTDGEMRRPCDAVADAHRAGGPGRATYLYRFDEPLAGRLAHLGACHAADLPFPFGTVDRDGWADVLGPGASALAGAVQAAWTAFATTGDPSCPEMGRWPALGAGDERPTMLLVADGCGVVDDPDGDRRRAWAELAPVRRGVGAP